MVLGSVQRNTTGTAQSPPAPPWKPHGSGVAPGLSPTNRDDSTVPSLHLSCRAGEHCATHWGKKI